MIKDSRSRNGELNIDPPDVTLPGYDSSSPEGLLCSGLAGECAFNQGAVVVDEAGQEPEVDDGAVACGHEVDYLAHGGGFLVAGDDKCSWVDLAEVSGLVEEGPDVAGLVFVIEVGGDVHVVHLTPPLARSRF